MISLQSARKWQGEAFTILEATGFRGIVEVATGGGKTLFALMVFQHLLDVKFVDRVLVIVPTIALADQWYVNFQEDFGLGENQISILNSKTQFSDLREANIVVLNTARNLHFDDAITLRTFLVVDECHRAGSTENARSMRGLWAATLGLSATPDRQYDDGTIRYLEPVLGSKIYSYSVRQALEDNVLCSFDLCNIQVPMTQKEQSDFDKISRRIARAVARQDLDDENLQALLRRRARLYNSATYRIPATVRVMDNHRGERSMVFHESIDAANQIAQLLRANGHSVALYHSKVAENVRRENLRLFRRGVVDVLVTCRSLDEGANMPETRVAVIAAASASTRQRIQRLGRVLRPAPGKESATVYSLFATAVERRRLEDETSEFEGIVDVQWKIMTDNR
jgi:superfamily II DNA or RNA helicase